MTDTDRTLADARDRGLASAAQPVHYIPEPVYRGQKASLTRAINSGDPEKVKADVIRTVREWRAGGYAWPDNWTRWQRALDDAMPFYGRVLVEDIR